MTRLDKLSPQALRAAMKGGTSEWGERGSVVDHIVYAEPQTARGRYYLKCRCGCERKATHRAMANGICMMEACEMAAHRFAMQANRARPGQGQR